MDHRLWCLVVEALPTVPGSSVAPSAEEESVGNIGMGAEQSQNELFNIALWFGRRPSLHPLCFTSCYMRKHVSHCFMDVA